jgi:hypothetical protein
MNNRTRRAPNPYEILSVEAATPDEAARQLRKGLNRLARRDLRLRAFLVKEPLKYIVLVEQASAKSSFLSRDRLP